MPGMFTLKDDVESVNLIDGTNYKLVDDSLVLSTPSKNERMNENAFFSGRDLMKMSYGSRSVEFQFYALGTTIAELSNNVSKIQRILTRAANHVYLRGGYAGGLTGGGLMQDHVTYANGSTTGDHGVVLQIRRGSDVIASLTQESNNSAASDVTPIYTLRVISGEVEIMEKGFASAMTMADGKYGRLCRVVCRTEPFFIGPSRIISSVSDGNGYWAGSSLQNLSNVRGNRIFVPAASVPGDADALTRIVTNMQGSTGVIIARDAGVSILNCPSVPTVVSGSGKADFFLFGNFRSNNSRPFRFKIESTGTPDTFSWSQRNYNNTTYVYSGTTGRTGVAITPNVPQKLISGDGTVQHDIYIVWLSSTGHTAGNEWQFDPHQAYLGAGSAVNIYDPLFSGAYSETGMMIYSKYVNVPPGCRGKYKMIAYIATDPGRLLEYRMRVQYTGYNGSTFGTTEPQYYEWGGPYGGILADLGTIDLTSVSAPFLSHPHSYVQMLITIMARTTQTLPIVNPTNATVHGAYLIPASDEFAYMQAGWKYDGTGYEVYSNYDPTNPYIGEESANYFNNGGNSATGKLMVGLDATYGGNVVTLLPGVDQTLLFVPLFGVTSDWRRHVLASGKTGNTYVAIRPRYLHLPG